MPGWIFVSGLLAAATVLAAIGGRPLELVVLFAIITVASAVAGALLRPDRQGGDPTDEPRS